MTGDKKKEGAPAKPPKQAVTNKAGKPISCWHCGEHHRLANCPKAKAKWKATMNALAASYEE